MPTRLHNLRPRRIRLAEPGLLLGWLDAQSRSIVAATLLACALLWLLLFTPSGT